MPSFHQHTAPGRDPSSALILLDRRLIDCVQLFRIFGPILQRNRLKSVIDEYTGPLLSTIENALKEDKILFDDYLRDSRTTWLLTMPKFIADHLWIEQFSQRVRHRIEPLKIIDGSNSKHKDVYVQVLEQERTLQRAAKEFLETTNDRWRSKLQTENLLHLNEPLLRKEKDYYLVNVKPDVILATVREGSPPLALILADDHSGRSHASLPTADSLDLAGSRGILPADHSFSRPFHRSRYTTSPSFFALHLPSRLHHSVLSSCVRSRSDDRVSVDSRGIHRHRERSRTSQHHHHVEYRHRLFSAAETNAS